MYWLLIDKDLCEMDFFFFSVILILKKYVYAQNRAKTWVRRTRSQQYSESRETYFKYYD